eukprot:CAMPEP_0201486358 /NCGR_PEP_ID=MMETSP0151_2-20130828/10420_1 /ASSEMBLY_ACC=CAM_ASM_000257 /TAXON_ID=200890 /ORGANISM="Paramoeba atlantica, Strain 621/1 / CCAP 1560/9" /LENGTH=565 /DNA_ID=CAMNT_0047870943 /DNA_START=71 /DNA_END=1765 /DNA_ORIENTATION=+
MSNSWNPPSLLVPLASHEFTESPAAQNAENVQNHANIPTKTSLSYRLQHFSLNSPKLDPRVGGKPHLSDPDPEWMEDADSLFDESSIMDEETQEQEQPQKEEKSEVAELSLHSRLKKVRKTPIILTTQEGKIRTPDFTPQQPTAFLLSPTNGQPLTSRKRPEAPERGCATHQLSRRVKRAATDSPRDGWPNKRAALCSSSLISLSSSEIAFSSTSSDYSSEESTPREKPLLLPISQSESFASSSSSSFSNSTPSSPKPQFLSIRRNLSLSSSTALQLNRVGKEKDAPKIRSHRFEPKAPRQRRKSVAARAGSAGAGGGGNSGPSPPREFDRLIAAACDSPGLAGAGMSHHLPTLSLDDEDSPAPAVPFKNTYSEFQNPSATFPPPTNSLFPRTTDGPKKSSSQISGHSSSSQSQPTRGGSAKFGRLNRSNSVIPNTALNFIPLNPFSKTFNSPFSIPSSNPPSNQVNQALCHSLDEPNGGLDSFSAPGTPMSASCDVNPLTVKRTQTILDWKTGKMNLPTITGETLCDVLDGKYVGDYQQLILIDSRFPYEYEGGHARGAVNLQW